MATTRTGTSRLVRDLMSVGVTTCQPETPIVEVARLLVEKSLEAVIVLDEEGHALGVVGQDELVRAYAREGARSLKAGQILREGVPQIPPDIPLAAAAQIMQDLQVRALFLMHHAGGIEYPAAYISYRHFLRHLAASSPDDLRDLGIEAERRPPVEVFVEKRDAARKSRGRR